MLIGTLCRLSLRFCAVTMMSGTVASGCCSGAWAAGAAGAGASLASAGGAISALEASKAVSMVRCAASIEIPLGYMAGPDAAARHSAGQSQSETIAGARAIRRRCVSFR